MTIVASSPAPDPASDDPICDSAPASHRERLNPTLVAEMRALVEGTCKPFKRIAAELGVSPASISRYAAQEGWQRPPGASPLGSRQDRVTERLWKLTERHVAALEDQPFELAQRSLQPLARLTRTLGDMDKASSRNTRHQVEPDLALAQEPSSNRSLHELRAELEAHLLRIQEEEGYGWEVREWWFESGGGI